MDVAPFVIEPVVLETEHVTLEPMTAEHAAGMRAAACDGKLWELWYTSVPAPDAVDAYIATALQMREREGALPFVVREKASGDIVGSTRFFNVAAAHRRVEIGYTWYAKRVQRSAVNTECKLALLGHAFEKLACIAVEFRTHAFNFASREAIARLGAKQDGILRNHQLLPDGTRRDTVVFSILDTEWPAVKKHLCFRLCRHLPSGSDPDPAAALEASSAGML